MISSVKPLHPHGIPSVELVQSNGRNAASEVAETTTEVGGNGVEACGQSVAGASQDALASQNAGMIQNASGAQIASDAQNAAVETQNAAGQIQNTATSQNSEAVQDPDATAEHTSQAAGAADSAAGLSKLVGVDYLYLSSKPIFDGANGVIYRSTDINKSTVFVIKTVRIQNHQLLDMYRRSVVREFDNLKKCAASKQVVTVMDMAANSNSPEISLIVKYYPNGDLLDCLCKLRTKKIELKGNLKDAIFKQIVRGVDFLHRHDIAHRDIKPENFLIDESGVIKLNDFGYSLDVTKLDEQLPLNDLSCGTPSFKAPELYQIEKDVSENRMFDAKLVDFKMVDIWAVGVLAFQLFLMSKPWQHANVVTDSKNVTMEKYISHYPDNEKDLVKLANKLNDRNHSVSSNPALSLFKKLHYDARILVLEMLHPIPDKRYTTEKLLQSSWLTQAYADPKDLIKLILK